MFPLSIHILEPSSYTKVNVTTETVLLPVRLWADTQVSPVAYLEGSTLDCTRVWTMPGLVWVPVREALPRSPVSLARMLKLSGGGVEGRFPVHQLFLFLKGN